MDETAASQTVSDRRREDRVMVELVLAGDNTAYRGLVEKYQERVYTMVYGMLRNREDARDVTQDAFVKAYRNLKGFRLESSFYTWIYRIAMNVAIDLTRKRKRREAGGLDEGMAARNEQGEVHEQAQDMPRPVPMDAVQFGPRGAQISKATGFSSAHRQHRAQGGCVARRAAAQPSAHHGGAPDRRTAVLGPAQRVSAARGRDRKRRSGRT